MSMSEDAVRVDPSGPGRGPTAGRGTAARRDEGSVPGLPVPTELVVLAVTALAVLIAAAVADTLDAGRAWTLVTALAAAYILSRGLAKREHRGSGHER